MCGISREKRDRARLVKAFATFSQALEESCVECEPLKGSLIASRTQDRIEFEGPHFRLGLQMRELAPVLGSDALRGVVVCSLARRDPPGCAFEVVAHFSFDTAGVVHRTPFFGMGWQPRLKKPSDAVLVLCRLLDEASRFAEGHRAPGN